ncbi:2,3-bisphosphoglycerate-dependent phosphoglycerate mutase (plasmid) [Agrobacterium tumefaciens]|uniref:2,3-bisphosphoglycerate-dependent phosphoglycerate mutase n=1 Tax=Agrobacterium tumefaciens TaxID=358 RepID=UPI001EED0E67|nr:2,3-bisphosphoglycerate-dependent phosphoglycerate mutase [Agrobacterium tumefaciens]WQE43580.1 2,3-bisphosphoglycerate-dependent phosphoglycerate mutase [Agrobacterium tumefaciens]
MSTLVLVRQGQSAGNERNEFTGSKEVRLTNLAARESRIAGAWLSINGITFDCTFSSRLSRAMTPAIFILTETNRALLKPHTTADFDERDYGELSGINKDEARSRWGDDLHISGGAPIL